MPPSRPWRSRPRACHFRGLQNLVTGTSSQCLCFRERPNSSRPPGSGESRPTSMAIEEDAIGLTPWKLLLYFTVCTHTKMFPSDSWLRYEQPASDDGRLTSSDPTAAKQTHPNTTSVVLNRPSKPVAFFALSGSEIGRMERPVWSPTWGTHSFRRWHHGRNNQRAEVCVFAGGRRCQFTPDLFFAAPPPAH
jgi:hypothetical protein